MVREEFVVDEWETKGIGNDYDDALGLGAIWRFGDVGLSTVNLRYVSCGRAIMLVAL